MASRRATALFLAVNALAMLALTQCQDPLTDPAADTGRKDTAVVLKPVDTTKPPLKPDTGKPVTGIPVIPPKGDTVKPPLGDTVKPDTIKPDTVKPPKGDTVKPDTAKPVLPGCNAADWVAGKDYAVGAVVRYPADGKYYKCTNANPGYDPTVSTWFWSPHACTGGTPIDTVKPPKGDTVKADTGKPAATGFPALFSEAQFNVFFSRRNGFYTYQGLVEATASYPAFANTGDLDTRKREVAAFLANVAHETGQLVYVEEIAKGEYCGHDWSGRCACQAGKKYYGRGPIQISWNYNYGAAGAALNLPLCADPDLVARDSKVAWQTGLWFWMTQSGAGSQSCHAGITGGSGFGATIRTINGGLECDGKNPANVTLRVNYYKSLCRMLGVDPGANTGC